MLKAENHALAEGRSPDEVLHLNPHVAYRTPTHWQAKQTASEAEEHARKEILKTLALEL
jgi:hypothetical protein